MSDIYFCDLIDIIDYPINAHGIPGTPLKQENIKARIEDTNKIVKNQNGEEMTANTFLMVDQEANINYESKIKLKKKNNNELEIKDKEFAILKVGKETGFIDSHWEVYL